MWADSFCKCNASWLNVPRRHLFHNHLLIGSSTSCSDIRYNIQVDNNDLLSFACSKAYSLEELDGASLKHMTFLLSSLLNTVCYQSRNFKFFANVLDVRFHKSSSSHS